MRNYAFRKVIVFGIIVLFVGAGVIPSTGTLLEYTNNNTKEIKSTSTGSDIRIYAVDYSGHPWNSRFIWFDPEDLYMIHDIGKWPNLQLPRGATFIGDEEWVCDTIGNIWKKNPDSPDVEYVGRSGTGELVDIAYHENSKTLYGMSTKKLYSINMSTGKASLIGSMGNSGLMITLDCDNEGIMYASELPIDYAYLYTIDLNNGTATKLSCSPPYGISKMSFGKDEDVMWMAISGFGTFQGELWTMEMKNYTSTFVGYFQEGVELSCLAVPYDISNQPPDPPTINGPVNGKIGTEYEYTFTTIDPNGNDVFYYINWDDGTSDGWLGPFGSGENVSVNHTWSKTGIYVIQAQAKNTDELKSEWGTLEVIMPRNKATFISFFLTILERFPMLREVLSWLINL